MSQDYEQEKAVALEAVRAASEVCRIVQQKITPDVMEKKDRSPVTVADFASQAMICRALESAFPDDPIIGEEDASELRDAENRPFLDRVQQELSQVGLEASSEEVCHWIDRGNESEFSERFWTLDPIDGTKGFLRKGQYAVALALIIDGKVALGALACPNLPVSADAENPAGAIFFALRGQGSWVLPLDAEAEPNKIEVSRTSETKSARFCESVESGHSSHGLSARVANDLEITREPIRLDSQAKYSVVARGEADIYMRLPVNPTYREKIWDHAAGVLIVEESGGRVTDVTGRPLEFTHGSLLSANRGVVASNQKLHSNVLTALEENFKG